MTEREQTFLIGPSLYLRPVVLADASAAAIWRDSPFPAPPEVVEDQLKRRLQVSFAVQNANQLLIACRRDTGQVIGSATVSIVPFRSGDIVLTIDHLLSSSDRLALAAELLDILVGWLLDECNLKWASFTAVDDAALPANAIASRGGRLAWRLRDAGLVRGRRVDTVGFQFFNPVWIRILGEPPTVSMGDPVPGRWPAVADLAGQQERDQRVNAIATGPNVYLRPFEPAESDLVAETWLQETERYLPGGRTFGNPLTFAHVHTSIARVEPPRWIRFAVCLSATNELIGISGLREVDWIHRTAESQSGILLPKHRNRGLSMEMKYLLLDYAFNRLGLAMVWARVEEPNNRSAAALRKQGYREAGYMAWTRLNATGMSGDWYFDVLDSEWRAMVASSGDDRSADQQ